MAALGSGSQETLHLGDWLSSGDYRIGLDFRSDKLSLGLAALFSLLCLLVIKFSVNYMHREAGYHRFFFVLSLFTAAMQLLVTAGNGALTFAGWEIAGFCSYLLIGYAYDRDNAAGNAVRVFVANRIGDAGFVAGLALSFLWLGGIEWDAINNGAAGLGDGQRFALAVCFLTAAMAKSA
ncbi:proton-conducting transporter membrane subunit, partial [Methylogaea oryzae]|uniref:proton-conducting transporter transmembrane domain-containing protein n=1 Tax=Methylogaea oryzae TaxID=1295382 RepID=UPI0026E596F1